jgi:hypothetical protein
MTKLTICYGSGAHVGVSLGQMHQTAGAVRPNKASGVRCRACGRAFPTARIAYTDHGILTGPQAVIPRSRPVPAPARSRRARTPPVAPGSAPISAPRSGTRTARDR